VKINKVRKNRNEEPEMPSHLEAARLETPGHILDLTVSSSHFSLFDIVQLLDFKRPGSLLRLKTLCRLISIAKNLFFAVTQSLQLFGPL
jgi:hypothetical protein